MERNVLVIRRPADYLESDLPGVRNDGIGVQTQIHSLAKFFCDGIYILQTFPQSYTQLSTTVTDLNGHHKNFQKDSWLQVPHSCHKQNMLLLRPVEETPALPVVEWQPALLPSH